MNRSYPLVVLGALVLQGCLGSPRAVLKNPISAKCKEAGLRRCAAFTEGAVLHAEGKAKKGIEMLDRALIINKDKAAGLREFAQALRTIHQEEPFAAEYVPKLEPAAAHLEAAAGPAPVTASSKPQAGAPKGSTAAAAAASGGANPGGFVIPAARTDAAPSALFPGATVCAYEVPGAVTVTDLFAPPRCPHDLVVYAGTTAKPEWVMWAKAGEGLSLRGLALPVKADDVLAFCAVGPRGKPLQGDPSCGINWRGTRGVQ